METIRDHHVASCSGYTWDVESEDLGMKTIFLGSRIQANLIAYLNLIYKINRGITDVLYTCVCVCVCVCVYTHTHVHACSVVSDSATSWTVAHRLLCPWNSPVKNTGLGCHSLLKGIFPTQGSILGLLYFRQILYCLNHRGNKPIKHVKCA